MHIHAPGLAYMHACLIAVILLFWNLRWGVGGVGANQDIQVSFKETLGEYKNSQPVQEGNPAGIKS
jgi:hypothetical protein